MKVRLLILFVSILLILPMNLQAAKDPITFGPKKIEQTIGIGDQVTIPISFTISKKLGECKLWIVPELRPYISLSQDNSTSFELLEGLYKLNCTP